MHLMKYFSAKKNVYVIRRIIIYKLKFVIVGARYKPEYTVIVIFYVEINIFFFKQYEITRYPSNVQEMFLLINMLASRKHLYR